MTTTRIITLFLCALSFIRCSDGGDDPQGGKPALSMTIASPGSTSVTLDVKIANADHMRVMCIATEDKLSQTARSVARLGKEYTGTQIVIEGLNPLTTYTIFAVAYKNPESYSTLQIVQFETGAPEAQMYPWEKSRNGILSYTDMVLCYGGSHHRVPYRWDKERFAPFVSYADEQGKEHWLFDSFLCIEFQDSSRPDGGYYAYMVGLMKDYGFSAGKTQWQELIDYWFAPGSGVNALEEAVKEASTRLGAPPAKRKVIMIMPDPIIYKVFDGKGNGTGDPSSTTYWGALNGRTMDFATAEDRIEVYKWYIDKVRKKFNDANYSHVELAGFYIISEELVTPGDGWNHELKKSDEIIPPIAEYLHSLNQSLCWIPYNRAAGYKKWKQLGVDYAYMQPNYFWDDKGERPLSRFFSDVKAYDLAMEFEFDEALLEGKTGCDTYRQRFRAYMSNAKSNNVYGRKPLSYYHGTNAFYDLSKSTAAKDKEFYHEFCQFVLDNPLRK